MTGARLGLSGSTTREGDTEITSLVPRASGGGKGLHAGLAPWHAQANKRMESCSLRCLGCCCPAPSRAKALWKRGERGMQKEEDFAGLFVFLKEIFVSPPGQISKSASSAPNPMNHLRARCGPTTCQGKSHDHGNAIKMALRSGGCTLVCSQTGQPARASAIASHFHFQPQDLGYTPLWKWGRLLSLLPRPVAEGKRDLGVPKP